MFVDTVLPFVNNYQKETINLSKFCDLSINLNKRKEKIMIINLLKNKVIDGHCHPFLPSKENEKFEQYWTLSMNHIPEDFMKNTLLYKLIIKELANFLELDRKVDDETVIKKRNEIYKKNPKKYITSLFTQAKIEKLLVDTGFPSAYFTGYSVDINDFKKNLPKIDVRTIIRIETIIEPLLDKKLSFKEFEEEFMNKINSNVSENNAVALKSIIAYLTGLEIRKVRRDEAVHAYDRYINSKINNLKEEKILRDYLFLCALEICKEKNLPIQIHTGFGDSPILDLRLSNPLSLYPIISDSFFKDIQFVLVHSGYHYTTEAGILANHYSNVWLDLSEMNPFAGIGVERKLLELIENVPLTKLCYGTDGYNIPEIFWFGSIYFKKVLSKVLSKLVYESIINEDYAYEVGKNILENNSKKLYKLN